MKNTTRADIDNLKAMLSNHDTKKTSRENLDSINRTLDSICNDLKKLPPNIAIPKLSEIFDAMKRSEYRKQETNGSFGFPFFFSTPISNATKKIKNTILSICDKAQPGAISESVVDEAARVLRSHRDIAKQTTELTSPASSFNSEKFQKHFRHSHPVTRLQK